MHTKRIFWIVILTVLVAVVLLIGFALRQHHGPEEFALWVNGEPISQADLDEAFEILLRTYRQIHLQSGGDFERMLSGPAEGYYKLQIKHQAALQLVGQLLIRQEARRRGISIPQIKLEQAFQERYQRFLKDNGLTEEGLRELFQDPEKKRLTQRLLGIRDESVEALKDRLLRQTEDTLLKNRLAEAVLGGVAPDSDEGKERWRSFLDEAIWKSKIIFSDPLLHAYHLERRVDQAKTLEERLSRLNEAISAYEEIKAKGLSPDPNLDYYLAQLHNLRVNWSLQLEQELKARAQESHQAQQKLEQLKRDISRSREKANQFFLSSGVDDERQLQAFMAADPNNPFYYYLYAQYLLIQRQDVAKALRWIKKALELDPQYVEAHVLLGDLNIYREHFAGAIEAYSQALTLAEERQARGEKPKAAEGRPEAIQLKLAQAYLDRARQLEKYPQLAEDSTAQRASSISQAEERLEELLHTLEEKDPDYATVLAALGDVESLKGNYAVAIERYHESLAHHPDIHQQVKLGQAYLLNQQLPEAEQAFQAALKDDPNYAPARLGLARLFRAQDKKSEALREYKQAFAQGRDLSYIERREIALEALELDPNDAEMHLMLADFYLKEHVYEGAIKEYQAVLEGEPHSISAYKGLGLVSIDKLEYEQAMKYFRSALAQNPPPEEQVELYELMLKAARLFAGPGKPVGEEGQEALYQLATLYLRLGQPDKSRYVLRELREKYPDYSKEEAEKLWREYQRLAGDDLPGRAVADQGHWLIQPGEPHPPYNSVPPTSGWHYAIPAPWGIHENPIPDEVQLRNLAGGGVLIQYPPAIKAETLQKLRTFVVELRKDPKYCRLILAPYEGLKAITLTAWNRIEELAEFEEELTRSFIDAFIGKGPEMSEVSCSP